MSGHTPGPWILGYDGEAQEYIRGGSPEIRPLAVVRWGCSCCKDCSNLTETELANARLIAAAPELLEALEEIVKGEGRYSRDPLEHAANTIEDMKALAQRAIDKAMGR